MKKTIFMSAAKKARIALAVMAVFGMSFVGAQEAFAADVTTDLPVKTDAGKNIICGDGAKAEKATSSTVDPANDIVIGVNAIANDKNSIAIGTSANAKAENSVAIGYGSVADAANTISFGSAFDDSKNKRLVNLAAGTSNNDAAIYGQVITSVKQNGNKLEFYTGTNTTKAMDVELYHPINFKGSNLVSNGVTIVTDSTVTGNSINNIVIGDYAKASKGYDSRYNCESNPQYNIIIGNSAQAKGVDNIVMGAEATTDGTYGVVLGYKAQSKGEGIAIGAGSKANYGVAIRGTAEGSGTIAISNFSEAKGYFNTAIGYSAKATGSESSLALGNGATASEKLTTAIGYSSKAAKEGSIAIGSWAETTKGNLAIGYNAKATGEGSIAYSGTASGESSLALGGTASGKSSYALGGLASGKQSVSIGAGSVAKYDNVVSVGMGEDTQWWNSLPAYRRIVNMADGINEHDAATFGQIIKKDTYTISLDAAGNGNVVLKTNAATDNDGPTIKVDASALETQITKNADAIGTLTNLTTTEKTNLVGAVNEVKGTADDALAQANTNKTSIGTLTSLTTTEKGNLVGAVNEVKGTADSALGLANTNKANIGSLSANGTYIKKTKNVSENLVALDTQVKANADDITIAKDSIRNVSNKIGTKYDGNYIHAVNPIGSDLVALDKQVKVNADAIGTLTNLTTTEKGNLVGAVNEVKGTADAALAQATTNKNSIGTLTSLTTTEKDNLVGAVNEVKGTADSALAQANTNKTSIGTLTNLTTTEKSNLVGAVNEVKGTADSALAQANTNTTAIAGKADLGLSNINAAGETVIKNLAKTEAGAIVNVQLGDLSTEKYYVDASKKVNENISALDKQVKTNADDIIAANTKITNVDNKIGSLSADGTYIKKAKNVSENLVALDTQVKANVGAITAVDNKIGTIAGGTYVEAGKNVAENLGKLDTQVKANADDIIAANTKISNVDNKIGSLSADGTYIKKAKNVSANLVELDNQVNANATALTNKANLDLSNINVAGETVIKNLAKTEAGAIVNVQLGDLSTEKYYVDAGKKVNENISALDKQVKVNADAIDLKANQELSNINATGENKIKTIAGVVVEGKLGTLTSLNYVDAANTVNANISALDVQVKTNTDAIGSLSADGTYIKQANNVSENLVELDKQVNTNTTAIADKADKNLSNISAAGKNVIINLAGNKAGEVLDVKLGTITSKHYVNAGNTVNANISALDTQLNNVENKVGTMTDGSYISAGNTVAGNLSALDAQLKNNTDAIADKADKNLSNITDAGKNVIRDLANEKAGELVDSKLGTITSNNYVSAGNTVNANISKLDEQVKANADAINTKADKDLSNITDAGKNVIKDLASVKAGEVVDAKLGDITSENYVNAGNTVNANISALDKQMKVNTDNIGDTGKLTTAGLGSNLSDAVVNVNNKVGTADELKALKDAGLGDNLAQATAAVNKKADKNAEDIKTVNGRVDELGGRVDTLGGAVSKLDTKVNKVGAGAAALAALHPMEFDSDNKLTFAAGVGSYHGASAAAIGAFYRPSEQVMFSISGNMGNGENMVNAGVSFALDRPSKTPTTKAALVKTVAAQNEQIAALSETVAEQNEKIARLEAMVEKLAAKQNA